MADEAIAGGQGSPPPDYRRDRLTRAAFAALLAFGFIDAVLGPVLPYLRAVEHSSYVVGAMHQAAFAVGGGVAGLLAVRPEAFLDRRVTIRVGLAGAALAALGIGYGDAVVITVPAAALMSLFASSALIRIWAALADAHGARRAVAMTEGEVWVSLGGIITPLLVAGLAATVLTWRFAFVVGGLIVAAGVLAMSTVHIPGPTPSPRRPGSGREPADRFSPVPTLVVVFAIVALEFSLSFWLASYLNDSVGVARGLAVVMVGGLYAANLAGRLLASRLAPRTTSERLLGASLVVALSGVPFLLAAGNAAVAAIGIALAGIGIGAMFPLTSSLHVGVSSRSADAAIGQAISIAAVGQIVGPLAVGAIAQIAGLRVGLLILPALILLAAAGLGRYRGQTGSTV